MNEAGMPQKLLARLGSLIARCGQTKRDDAARVSLGRLASECGRRHPSVALEAIATLVQDNDRGVRDAAADHLRELFANLGGLARLGVAVNWATSGDAHKRLAAARALGGRTPVMGFVSMVDQLSRDPDPRIRYAACLSCSSWMESHPHSLVELLSICAGDENTSVSSAAVDGLRRASSGPSSRIATDALVELAGSTERSVAEAARAALDGGRR